MLGLFGIFGRSAEIRRLEDALREAGLHPRLMPDAVKIAAVRLLREHFGRQATVPEAARAAELLSFCIIGGDDFAAATSDDLAAATDERVAAAAQAGDGLDAHLILLVLHAGLAHDGVVSRHGLCLE